MKRTDGRGGHARRASVCLAALLLASCAARAPVGRAAERPVPGASLSEYLAKVRHLQARPAPAAPRETIEERDAELAAALAMLEAAPAPAIHRRLGQRYRALGMLDAAYQHFNAAVSADAADAAALDGLARVWRDWGLPELGLGDAYRAVYFAPASAAARNTLGTLLQAAGHRRAAQRAYEDAARLDSRAAYAVNNLCYLYFLDGALDRAIDLCAAAIALDPDLVAARHNLALVHAAGGRLDLAAALLRRLPSAGDAFYNVGIMRMSAGDYQGAIASFESANRANSQMALARMRAAEASQRLTRP